LPEKATRSDTLKRKICCVKFKKGVSGQHKFCISQRKASMAGLLFSRVNPEKLGHPKIGLIPGFSIEWKAVQFPRLSYSNTIGMTARDF
jgi:hypothetical protein